MKIFFSQPKEKNSVPSRPRLQLQATGTLIKDWRNVEQRQVNNNNIKKKE
jgi:hypothetical protein